MWWTFIITNLNTRFSAHPALWSTWVDCDLWMPWQKSNDPFYIDITAIWVCFTDGESWAHHQGPQRPCSELSRLCLNGTLIILLFLCCCFVFPSGVCPLSTSTFYPTAVKPCQIFFPHQSSCKSDSWNWQWHLARDVTKRISVVKRDWRDEHSLKPFISIHQLPRCTSTYAKNRKSLFFSL